MSGRRFALVVLLLATGGWGWDVLRAPDPDVEKGNEAFKGGNYREALGHYDAAERRGTDPRIQFDRGAALYKLGDLAKDPAEAAKLMEQAEQAFERAADTGDARLKSDAYQALGNTLYRRERYEEAVDKYRRALRADPQNDAARYNLEMALRHRQKNQQQQQQQQGQQGQQGQQQGQPQQGQQDPQQGQPQQGQQDPQQGQQGQEQDPQQGQGQGQPQDPQQQGQGQEQQDPQQGQGQGQPQQKDPTQGDPNAPKQDPGKQQGGQPQPDPNGQGGQKDQRPGGENDDAEGEPPSDEDQKLDALERRSRDLRKRLLRKGSRTRDPLRLPSRKDW